MNHETRTHLDLFSGIGGFSLAAQWAGFRTVGFCEIDPYAQQILIKNFGAVLADATARQQQQHPKARNGGQDFSRGSPIIHADIRTLNGADYFGVDLITGGFPCQPYSLAGKRRGAADNRALWPEMRRVIAEARPGWVLGENVPGIIGMELDTVLSDLENLGYATGTIVVPACAVDAPHRRDRVWIVAHAERGGSRTGFSQGGSLKDGVKSPNKSCDVPNSNDGTKNRTGTQCNQRKVQDCNGEGNRNSCNWLPEPELGRVAHGIPNRVDRLKCLGNAIVPQVAAQILKAMIQSEESEPRGA